MTDEWVDFSSQTQRADIINRDMKVFEQWFILNPSRLMEGNFVIDKLNWESISLGNKAEISKVPNDKRGIYAFVICWENSILPQHGYVLYIGIAGEDSDRSLRERYREYLRKSHIDKRDHISYAIGTWHKVIRFFFAPIDDDIESEDLKLLEEQIHDALLPPYGRRDFSAETRRRMRAF